MIVPGPPRHKTVRRFGESIPLNPVGVRTNCYNHDYLCRCSLYHVQVPNDRARVCHLRGRLVRAYRRVGLCPSGEEHNRHQHRLQCGWSNAIDYRYCLNVSYTLTLPTTQCDLDRINYRPMLQYLTLGVMDCA